MKKIALAVLVMTLIATAAIADRHRSVQSPEIDPLIDTVVAWQSVPNAFAFAASNPHTFAVIIVGDGHCLVFYQARMPFPGPEVAHLRALKDRAAASALLDGLTGSDEKGMFSRGSEWVVWWTKYCHDFVCP